MSESSIDLTKGAPKAELRKKDISNGPLIIRTTWSGTRRSVDVDLGIMWKGKGLLGGKGIIQALGRRYGSLTSMPYLKLDGDDRSGGKGETVTGDTTKVLGRLERFGVYTYVYSDEGLLADVLDAQTVIILPGMRPITIKHENLYGRAAAIAMCTITDSGITFERDLRTCDKNSEVDTRYWNFGFRWTPGTK